MPVSGPLIQQQALQSAKDLNNDTFKATYGLRDSLLKRNNIVFRTMTVERGDVDTTTVNDWKKNLPVCFFETTNKSFHTKGENCAGGKQTTRRGLL